jgi:PAS domain S-box-containing protein
MANDLPTWQILLVEDDEDDFLLTRSLLADFRGRTFELTWAPDVSSGLRCLDARQPDVVLVDYALGSASGLDFIRQALAAGCPAPFILLTGHIDYELDLLGMQAGASDYLPKAQLSPATLERSIRYAIERNTTERALRQARQELEQRVEERTRELAASNLELARANDLLELVFSGIHLQVAYLDNEFNFIRVNQNYAEANGWPPEFFIGKNHFELFPDEEAESIFLSVVESGEAFYAYARPFVNPLFPERGYSYWDWSLHPVLDPGGQVSGLVLSLLDVTERELATQALRAGEELLRAVVTGAPVILWAIDPQGTITLAEGQGLEKQGWAPEDLVGKSIYAILQGIPELGDYLRQALAGEEVFTIVRPENGVHLYTRYAPQRDASGRVSGVIGVATDVTEQVQAQARLAYQANLLDRVNDAILAMDENFTLTAWNRAAEDIYGWTAEEAIGQKGTDLPTTEMAGMDTAAILNRLAETGELQGEAVHYRKDGQLVEVEFRATALRDESGRITGYASVNRDITDRKRVEAELAEVQRSLLESVEAERQHIARELHDGPMQELYALAYELDALRAFSADGFGGKIDKLQNKLRLVSQVLRATATELRPPTLVPFGLEKALRSYVERFQKEHPELIFRVELDSDGQALPERVRLALFRIFQQALANVVQHAAAREVQVRFAMQPEEARLEIEDDGQGFQVPARWVELARQGHLGLVGAQERAIAVGGSFEVDSKPGEGTLIRVQVPVKALRQAPDAGAQ